MKFGPLQRGAITAATILLATGLYGFWRMLDSHGVFTSVTPGFEGTCRAIQSPAGIADIVFDGKIAIVSVADDPVSPNDKPGGPGLYLYDPAKPGLVKLSGTPKDFHPGALALYRGPGGSVLMVVNRRQDGEFGIDMFAFDGKTLKETGEIESGLLTSPSAIAAVDSQSFYVANEHTSKTAFGRWLDDTFALPRGDVLYFDGMKFLEAADKVIAPEGIELAPDTGHVYVAEGYGRALETFERNPFTGQLKQAGSLAIPADLGKMHLGPDGALWIAGSPKAYAADSYRADRAKRAPSVVYRAALNGGTPQNAGLVYANAGAEISAASTAAMADGHLLIGSAYGDKLLDCKLP